MFAAGEPAHPDDIRIAVPALAAVRPQSIRSLIFLLASLGLLFRLRKKVDVIHAHGDWSMALAGWISKHITGANLLVLSVHDGPIPSRVRGWLQEHSLRLADLVHTTGQRESVQLASHARGRVLWQPSGISDLFLEAPVPMRLRLSQGSRQLVVSMAVLRPKKNLGLILDIAVQMPAVDFVIFGDGPERSRLAKRIADERIGNVQLRGRADQAEIRFWLDKASAYLCTSLVEGTPTALLEAMARGVPVVTSRCGDFSGIVDNGVTGYVIDSESPVAYVQALHSLNPESEDWARMRQTCLARARKFSWAYATSTITATTLDVFKTMQEHQGGVV